MRLLQFVAVVSLLAPCPVQAGPGADGHTHGEDASPTATAASPRVAMGGENYDVVAIYNKARLVFYVDKLSDNSPVADAELEVTADKVSVTAERLPDGTYAINGPQFAPGGAYELVVSIRAPGGDDLVAGTLEVPTSGTKPALAPPQGVNRFRDMIQLGSRVLAPWSAGGLVLVFAGGLLAGFILRALMSRSRRKIATAILLSVVFTYAAQAPAFAGPGGDGHTHGDEPAPAASDAPHRLADGSVFVPKPTQRLLEVRTLKTEESVVPQSISMPGRVIASPHNSGVVQSINGGRVSIAQGRFPSLGQRVKKGELLTIVEPPVNAADETTIADKAGEIGQQIALAEARLQRLGPLAEKNAVPRTQVADLETELESLRRRHTRIHAQRRQTEELRAPVDGEIAAVRVTAGQVVAPQDQLFQIVDPGAMWVEAFVFDAFDPARIASAVGVGHQKQSFNLRFEGVGRILQLHTVQLQFSIENPRPMLMVGQPVSVLVRTAEQRKGVLLPREAVVRASNGEMIVWQHAASERFVPKAVRTEPVDGDQVLVVGGLEAGQRVVVKAAELINQLR